MRDLCDRGLFYKKQILSAMKRIFYAILIILFSAGCRSSTSAVPINPPESAIEQAVEEAEVDNLIVRDEPIPEQWWLLFNDGQLNEFIEKAFVNNPTLQTAKVKILAAFYNASSIQSILYPYLGLGADVSRQKLSTTGVIPFNTGPPGSGTPVVQVPATPGGTGPIPEYFTLYETELNFRYSFDFWEKNRNTFRAAMGQFQANIAEEAYARLELGILIAGAYYKLQTNFQRELIAVEFVDNRQRYYDLIQKRIQRNIDTDLSLQIAGSNLSDAKDILLQIQREIAVSRVQLSAYLAGDFDEEVAVDDITLQALPKVPVPECLPLHLISKRPDITAQLWLIESADRLIDVAKAGFYPDFNLAGFFGFQTIHFSKWFMWPSTFFNIDPAMTLPIFDGGRLIADLRKSEVNYDLAILEYNRLVINAAKEVLEAIAILRNSWARLQEFDKRYAAQSELYRLTHLRTLHNLSSSLDDLVGEANKLVAQDQTIIALGTTIQAILDLIKSLGGGYDN